MEPEAASLSRWIMYTVLPAKGNHVYIHIIDQDAFRKETLPAVSYKITKCLCHGKEIPVHPG